MSVSIKGCWSSVVHIRLEEEDSSGKGNHTWTLMVRHNPLQKISNPWGLKPYSTLQMRQKANEMNVVVCV